MQRERLLYFLVVFLSLLLIYGCTSSQPEIVKVFWQINLYNDLENNSTYEQLSLFLRVTDQDGLEDLSTIFLIQDEEELFWEINSDSWIADESDDYRWIGSNSLTMPDGTQLPRGFYRIILQDLSGEYTEKEIEIPHTSFYDSSQIIFPEVSQEETTISVRGSHSQATLWIFTENQKQHLIYPIRGEQFNVQALVSSHRNLASGFSFFVRVALENSEVGALSGPYYYPDQQHE